LCGWFILGDVGVRIMSRFEITKDNNREFSQEKVRIALERLSYIGIYRIIMDKLKRVDVSDDTNFQRMYTAFYRVRRDDKFREKYYRFMQEHKKNKKLTFKETLRYFNEIPPKRVEASFSSKLLHTLLPEKYPTWDEFIGRNTKITIPKAGTPKEKFDKAVKGYEQLIQWFKSYRDSTNGKDMLALFEKYYPNSGISDIKKIDLVLWQMDREKDKTDE
jgi:hypothetical protein